MRVRHKNSNAIYKAELSSETAYHRYVGIAGQRPVLMVYREDLGEQPVLTWPQTADDLYVVVRATSEEFEHLRAAGYKLPDRR